LASVTLPTNSSFIRIDNSLFQGCTLLASITIPNSVRSIGSSVFQGCTSLTSITIPTSVRSIRDTAFSASALATVSIANGQLGKLSPASNVSFFGRSVTTVTTSALETAAAALAEVIGVSTVLTYFVDQGATITWQGVIFNKNLSLPNFSYIGTAASIPTTSPPNVDYITDLIIGNSLTRIGNYMFNGSTNLRSITFSNSLTTIGIGAFSGCAVTNITIPNSVTSIGNSAFNSCNNLDSVTLPINPLFTIIRDSAFYECRSLTSITIPTSVTTIGIGALASCGFTSITIPNSVTTIGASAFYDSRALTSVTLPINPLFTRIEEAAFYDCIALETITLPISLTFIDGMAFYGSGLTSVIMADGQFGITSPSSSPISFGGRSGVNIRRPD
jgi:hypothetical protein